MNARSACDMDDAEYRRDFAARCRRSWPAGVPAEAHYPFGQIPLHEYLRRWAQIQPEKPAIIFYGTRITYAELDRLSDRFATLLASRGIVPGERVAVYMGNCPQFHIAFYGILKAGAIYVPVNPMFTQAELLHELQETGARAIVTHHHLCARVDAVRDATDLRFTLITAPGEMLPLEPEATEVREPPGLREPGRPCPGAIEFLPALQAQGGSPPEIPFALDAPAAINFTGGTTGFPKGCVHTQGDMIFAAASACTFLLRMDRDAVSLVYFAVFWISGQNAGMSIPVFSGSTVVLLARWDAEAAMRAVERYRVTHIKMVVDNVVEVLEHPKRHDFDLRSIRAVHTASFVKKFNSDIRARWIALTGSTIGEGGYGMTETQSHNTFTTGMEAFDLEAPGFIGLASAGNFFKIVDFETRLPAPYGTEGEICIHAPSIFKGYWKRDGSHVPATQGGWLATGDVGMLSPEGYLYFRGRRKEMLKVRGMSVYPAEIEAAIGSHPAVRTCAVVGRRDKVAGEVPVAFVILHDAESAEGAALREWCAERLAGFKVPEVRVVGEMPMTQTGKVKKEELKRLYAAELDPTKETSS